MSDELTRLIEQAKLLISQKKWDEAIPVLTEIINLARDPITKVETFSTRGSIYGKKGEYDQAIADFDQAIELNPKFADAFYNRGIAYSSKGEYNQAIADFDRAIEIQPKHAAAFYQRGMTYRKMGQKDKAIKDFKRANDIDPSVIPEKTVEKTEEKVEKTQSFQKTFGELEREYRKIKTIWLWVSTIVFFAVAFVFVMPFIYKIDQNINTYFIYAFLSVVTALVIRQYTNAKQLWIEAKNRIAMAEVLAHIENAQPDNKREFLPRIINSIVYSTTQKPEPFPLDNFIKYVKETVKPKE